MPIEESAGILAPGSRNVSEEVEGFCCQAPSGPRLRI